VIQIKIYAENWRRSKSVRRKKRKTKTAAEKTGKEIHLLFQSRNVRHRAIHRIIIRLILFLAVGGIARCSGWKEGKVVPENHERHHVMRSPRGGWRDGCCVSSDIEKVAGESGSQISRLRYIFGRPSTYRAEYQKNTSV